MATFDDLMEDEVVSSHPLLKGYKRLVESRRALEAQAHGLQEFQETLTQADLKDIFSEKNNLSSEALNMRGMVFEASKVLHDTLSQFMLPMMPKVSLNNTKDVKYARHSVTDIVEGLVIFNLDLVSKSGVRKQALVPVKVQRGEGIPPSIMEVSGQLYTVSQDSFDMVLDRLTTYELPEIRGQFEPPMTREERAMAIAVRDAEGPQPRDNSQNYLTPSKEAAITVPRGFAEVLAEIKLAESEDLDTFPRPWIYLLRNYVLNHVSTASRDQWEPHLINKGYAINPYGMNRGRKQGQVSDFLEEEESREFSEGFDEGFDKDLEMEVSGEPMEMEEVIEEVISQLMYPETKTPIESGDGIKFHTPKGKMQGTIVDIDPEGNTLIVKSKGMEYRVTVDDITPLPSTFKKMYM